MQRRRKLSEILKDMRSDPGACFSTAGIAREIGMSAATLNRRLHDRTGLPLSRYRAYLRMDEVQHRLVHTNDPITTIAFDVGYTSLGTFTRRFRKLVGISPGEFRRYSRQFESDDLISRFAASGAPEEAVVGTGDTLIYGCLTPEQVEPGSFMAIGLFSGAAPVGKPESGCGHYGFGRFSFRWPAGIDTLYCFGVMIPPLANSLSLWRPASSRVRVFSLPLARRADERFATVCITPEFRPIRDGDPPILSALPVILGMIGDGEPEHGETGCT